MAVYDTCGVGNLHGLPSLLGGLGSVFFVLMDSDADFLAHGAFSQAMRQIVAVFVTLGVAIGSGLFTGYVMMKEPTQLAEVVEYYDGVWWEGHYFEDSG